MRNTVTTKVVVVTVADLAADPPPNSRIPIGTVLSLEATPDPAGAAAWPAGMPEWNCMNGQDPDNRVFPIPGAAGKGTCVFSTGAMYPMEAFIIGAVCGSSAKTVLYTIVGVDSLTDEAGETSGLYGCGDTVRLEAEPIPAGRFPDGYPTWSGRDPQGEAHLFPQYRGNTEIDFTIDDPGTYTVTAHCGTTNNPDARKSYSASFVGVDRVELLNSAVEDPPIVFLGATAELRAYPVPQLPFPEGQPEWRRTGGPQDPDILPNGDIRERVTLDWGDTAINAASIGQYTYLCQCGVSEKEYNFYYSSKISLEVPEEIGVGEELGIQVYTKTENDVEVGKVSFQLTIPNTVGTPVNEYRETNSSGTDVLKHRVSRYFPLENNAKLVIEAVDEKGRHACYTSVKVIPYQLIAYVNYDENASILRVHLKDDRGSADVFPVGARVQVFSPENSLLLYSHIDVDGYAYASNVDFAVGSMCTVLVTHYDYPDQDEKRVRVWGFTYDGGWLP